MCTCLCLCGWESLRLKIYLFVKQLAIKDVKAKMVVRAENDLWGLPNGIKEHFQISILIILDIFSDYLCWGFYLCECSPCRSCCSHLSCCAGLLMDKLLLQGGVEAGPGLSYSYPRSSSVPADVSSQRYQEELAACHRQRWRKRRKQTELWRQKGWCLVLRLRSEPAGTACRLWTPSLWHCG